MWKIEKFTLKYTTSHTTQFKDVTERRIAYIKEGVLAMILNAKLNDTAQKMLWSETVHTCERVIKRMATTGTKKSPFENFYGEKTKIIGSFS